MASRRQRHRWSHSGHGGKTYGIKVTNLPHDITEQEVHDIFNHHRIANVVLKSGTGKPYAFVNFHTPSSAQTAANDMDRTWIGDKQIKCKVQTEGRSSVAVYTVKVMHISKRTTEKTLSSLFTVGTTPSVKIIRCPKSPFNFAYVNYSSQSDAEWAVNSLDEEEVNGSQIKVKLHIGQEQERPSSPSFSEKHEESADSVVQTPMYRSAATPVPDSESCTVKVSIFGESSLEDINEIFSQFGNIRGKPRIRGRDPRYTFINFSSPEAAADACTLHNARVDGIKITVKLHDSQSQGLNVKSKEVHGMTLAAVRTVTQAVQLPNTAESSRVKVSICGELSADAIKRVFSRFGKIRRKPYIRGRDPYFTFVNFTSPQAAADACRLHNSEVRGVKIYVKIQAPKKQGPNTESVEVQCTPLIASILCTKSKYKKKLQELKTKYHVQISLQPSSDSVEIVGEREKVTTVDDVLQDLIEELESDISEKYCKIPGHAVPLFELDSAIDELKKIKASYGIEICVLRGPPLSDSVELVSFCKDVKKCFTPTANIDAMPACSELVSYLKKKPCSFSTLDSETTWLWQYDSHSAFVSYSPEASSKLSKAFLSNDRVTLIKIGSQKYSIDFSKMTQTNFASRHSRPIKQVASNTLSVKWFYKDDRKVFVQYTSHQSAKIEQMFTSNVAEIMVINKNMYTFNFAAMTQCNMKSGKSRKIQRRCEFKESSVPTVEYVLTLQVRGLTPSIDQAIREIEGMVTKAAVQKDCQLYEGSSPNFKAELMQKMNKYFVTARLDGECLKLKGMPRYVERVYLLAEQEKISDREQQMHDGVGGKEFMLPRYWKPQSEDVSLIPVERGSTEWNKEVALILKTLSEATVVKLERIQNKWLWERYSLAKRRMSKTNADCVNEKHLFHGTRTTLPEKVVRSEMGIDFRYSREGLWGTGSYFAVNASYSDAYAYNQLHVFVNRKQMFICKVLTGDSFNAKTSDQSLRQPPIKLSSSQTVASLREERYDSVKGYTNGSYVYVVYDHEKVYPAYLVTYYL